MVENQGTSKRFIARAQSNTVLKSSHGSPLASDPLVQLLLAFGRPSRTGSVLDMEDAGRAAFPRAHLRDGRPSTAPSRYSSKKHRTPDSHAGQTSGARQHGEIPATVGVQGHGADIGAQTVLHGRLVRRGASNTLKNHWPVRGKPQRRIPVRSRGRDRNLLFRRNFAVVQYTAGSVANRQVRGN